LALRANLAVSGRDSTTCCPSWPAPCAAAFCRYSLRPASSLVSGRVGTACQPSCLRWTGDALTRGCAVALGRLPPSRFPVPRFTLPRVGTRLRRVRSPS